MNSALLCCTFLQGPLGLTVARARNEIIDFIGTFNDLLSTSEKNDDFVKTIHASNSARQCKDHFKPSVITGLNSLLYVLLGPPAYLAVSHFNHYVALEHCHPMFYHRLLTLLPPMSMARTCSGAL